MELRSTVLDSFTVEQMRVMKCGGNANAAETFKQYGGGGNAKDGKAKYTSKAAAVYKEKLSRWVQEDAKRYGLAIVFMLLQVLIKHIRYPDVIVIEGADGWEGNAPAETAKGDFFSDWELQAAAPASLPAQIQQKPPVPLANQPIPAQQPQQQMHKSRSRTSLEIQTIGEATAKAACLSPTNGENSGFMAGELDNAMAAQKQQSIHHHGPKPTSSSAILKPNSKRSLGAKKASKGISFEEAQRLANEEEERRKAKEAEDKKKAMEALSAPVVNHFSNPISSGSRSTSSRSGGASSANGEAKPTGPEEQVERLGFGMTRLGFGFQGGETPASNGLPPSNKKTAPPPVSSTPSQGFGCGFGSGFGSNGPSSQSPRAPEAVNRFGNAKAISSDQYFGRGAFDEATKYEFFLMGNEAKDF